MEDNHLNDDVTRELMPYANFLFEVGLLARTPRSGFRFLNPNYRQSVAEHLLRVTYIGLVLHQLEWQRGNIADLHQVLLNCFTHDLGEARAGDLDYVSQKYDTADELRAIKDAVAGLPFGDRIVAAFKQTESRTTAEGNIAKDADQLELLLSLKEITDNGNVHAKDWIPTTIKRLQTESAKQLASVIMAANVNEWWYGDRNDTHWITGGKKTEFEEDG